MLSGVIEISLICTGIHVCFWEGMIFGKYANRMEHWIFKPLVTCLSCMASVWTIILTQSIDIKLILAVCGMNTIIAAFIQFLEIAQYQNNG